MLELGGSSLLRPPICAEFSAKKITKASSVRPLGWRKVFPLKWAEYAGVIGTTSHEPRIDLQPSPAAGPTAMRISGGVARGITLLVPKGDAVRPATDGMRQAVFSSLGSRVSEAWFLDLFAGSGAYGLEAASRGAAGGVFVEQSAKAAACVRANIAAVAKSIGRGTEAFAVVKADARNVPLGGGKVPDLVFIDPPYEIIPEVAPGLFQRLSELLASKPDAVVVFEYPGEIELAPPGWELRKRLGKGARQPTVGFFLRAGPVAAA
jgi:16S rRNA (guanine966-N2)-methyltransferase